MRFVNDDDIVPRVPPTYLQIGDLYHFDANGNLQNRLESIESVATDNVGRPMLTEAEFDRLRSQLLDQRAQAKESGTESLESPVLEGLFPSLSDHRIDNYIAKIAGRRIECSAVGGSVDFFELGGGDAVGHDGE